MKFEVLVFDVELFLISQIFHNFRDGAEPAVWEIDTQSKIWEAKAVYVCFCIFTMYLGVLF